MSRVQILRTLTWHMQGTHQQEPQLRGLHRVGNHL